MRGEGTATTTSPSSLATLFIYDALERAAEHMRLDPIAAPFISGELTRLPAIEADLAFLIGDDWRERIRPLPTTERYVARIDEVSADWPGGFVAHHYRATSATSPAASSSTSSWPASSDSRRTASGSTSSPRSPTRRVQGRLPGTAGRRAVGCRRARACDRRGPRGVPVQHRPVRGPRRGEGRGIRHRDRHRLTGAGPARRPDRAGRRQNPAARTPAMNRRTSASTRMSLGRGGRDR